MIGRDLERKKMTKGISGLNRDTVAKTLLKDRNTKICDSNFVR